MPTTFFCALAKIPMGWLWKRQHAVQDTLHSRNQYHQAAEARLTLVPPRVEAVSMRWLRQTIRPIYLPKTRVVTNRILNISFLRRSPRIEAAPQNGIPELSA